MRTKWIAFVTRVDARVYSQKKFSLIITMDNSLGRAKNLEMTTGKPGMGRSRFSRASGLHALTGEKSPHERAAIAFARRIGEYFNKQFGLAQFDSLVVVAEPKMLGRVRKNITGKLVDHVEWMGKDLGHMKTHELAKMFGLPQS